jgi:predicted oxidoreductase
MERVRVSESLEMSRIVYGMWRVGDDPDTSAAHIQAKIEACLEQGITTIDQADIYGGYGAEEMLGDVFRATPGLSDKVEIVTKCDIVAPVGRHSSARVKYYDTSSCHILTSVDKSLSLMEIETIDLLLIHRPDPMMDAAETGRTLDDLVASGKVRNVGVSNFKLHDWTLLQNSMRQPLVTNQIELSLLAHQGFTNGDVAYLQERNRPIMAWSPLGGGALAANAADSNLVKCLTDVAARNDVDRAAVATAWLLGHPARILPVMGTNTINRIKGFSDAFKVKMDRQTWFELYTAALGQDVP